jgi:hypothetical protein
LFCSEAGGIRRGNATASSAKPSNPIFGMGNDAIAVIWRNRLPQVEFRLYSHPTIVSRVESATVPTAQKLKFAGTSRGVGTRPVDRFVSVLAE